MSIKHKWSKYICEQCNLNSMDSISDANRRQNFESFWRCADRSTNDIKVPRERVESFALIRIALAELDVTRRSVCAAVHKDETPKTHQLVL